MGFNSGFKGLILYLCPLQLHLRPSLEVRTNLLAHNSKASPTKHTFPKPFTHMIRKCKYTNIIELHVIKKYTDI